MITLLREGSVRSSSQLGRATRGLQVLVPQYWGPTTRAGVRVRPRAEAWRPRGCLGSYPCRLRTMASRRRVVRSQT